jgi:hypothetical protein
MGDSADSCPEAGKALLLLGTDQAACASPGAALHDNPARVSDICHTAKQQHQAASIHHPMLEFWLCKAADIQSNMLSSVDQQEGPAQLFMPRTCCGKCHWHPGLLLHCEIGVVGCQGSSSLLLAHAALVET